MGLEPPLIRRHQHHTVIKWSMSSELGIKRISVRTQCHPSTPQPAPCIRTCDALRPAQAPGVFPRSCWKSFCGRLIPLRAPQPIFAPANKQSDSGNGMLRCDHCAIAECVVANKKAAGKRGLMQCTIWRRHEFGGVSGRLMCWTPWRQDAMLVDGDCFARLGHGCTETPV